MTLPSPVPKYDDPQAASTRPSCQPTVLLTPEIAARIAAATWGHGSMVTRAA